MRPDEAIPRSRQRACRQLVAVAGCVLLASCAPVNDPSAGLSTAETVALIERTGRSDMSARALADAYAFGARSTDTQLATLQQAILGRTVEWDLPVADVGFADDRFEVMSQAIPVTSKDVVPTLKVIAFVVPVDEQQQTYLMSLKANDVVRIRGIVQEIRSGRTVALVPAIVVRRQLER